MANDNDFAEFVEFHVHQVERAPKRYIRDIENPLEVYNDNQFKKQFRFSKFTVINVLVPLIHREYVNKRGLPIPSLMKMIIALRYYATSSFQLVCGDLYDVSQPTAYRIISEVSETLATHINQYIKFPANQEGFRNIKTQFFQKAGFPGVIGVIDGTHIPIKSPGGHNGEVFRNRKTFFSINVQVVGGPNEEIMDLVVRWPGSAHDSRIFENIAIRVKLSEGQLPGHVLGDRGYPQRQYIYTPVPQPITDPQQRYNNAHKSTRSIIERTIGRWKRRFPCLYFEMQNKLRNITRIITSCAVLYNIGIQAGDLWELENLERRRQIIEVPVVPVGENMRGNVIRKDFIELHFNN